MRQPIQGYTEEMDAEVRANQRNERRRNKPNKEKPMTTTLKNVSTAKPMGHNQRQYAIKRIGDIYSLTATKIHERYPMPVPTYGDIIKLAKAGKLPIRKNLDVNETCTNYRNGVDVNLSDIFDQDAIDRSYTEAPAYKKAVKERIAAVEKWVKKCGDATDQIMLGDSETAMKVLAALEAYKI